MTIRQLHQSKASIVHENRHMGLPLQKRHNKKGPEARCLRAEEGVNYGLEDGVLVRVQVMVVLYAPVQLAV